MRDNLFESDGTLKPIFTLASGKYGGRKMDKKLENGKVAESSIVEEVPETPFEMDDMEEF